jgi:D-arabinose 1-dehydrogenase-like Zn-dependent alcohol dehydrogenase
MGVDAKPLTVPTSIMWVRGRIIGSSQNDPAHLYEALQLVASGKVKVITETYRLDEIGRAYDRVAEGKVRYRAVVVP